MRRMLLCLMLMVVMLQAGPAAASGLYEARVIVTGADLRSRPEGLTACLAQVLVKVSGNPALLDDPRLAALAPGPLVQGIAYLDRMSDQPKHDEQGTRDRPYDLVARFDPAGIDAALRGLGQAPWTGNRPALLAEITILPRDGPALALRADTDPDERHRAALLAAAERFGIEVLLRPAAGEPPHPPAGAVVLQGTLSWREDQFGWVGAWRLAGREPAWGIAGVGFDAAYRNAIGGAVGILSGRGPP